MTTAIRINRSAIFERLPDLLWGAQISNIVLRQLISGEITLSDNHIMELVRRAGRKANEAIDAIESLNRNVGSSSLLLRRSGWRGAMRGGMKL